MPFWNFIKNEATPDEVDLRIDGEIVSDDDVWFYEWLDIKVTAPNAFREELAQYKDKNITVWIDSWGGDTTAGTGIYNALKEHKGKVTVKIDGKAVSAASVIAMAGDEIKISPGGIIMIHNPWGVVPGEAKDMRHFANVLDEVKEGIINAYQLRTKKSRGKIAEMMDNETWMSAKTAIAEGFADEMLYTDQKEPAATNSFMFSRLAIQNSAAESMKRFFEQYKLKFEKPNNPESTPANTGRVFDYKKRVAVREKQNRRKSV